MWARSKGCSLAEIKSWSIGDLISASAQLRIDDLVEAAAIAAARKSQ